jgi:pSer/pThr/pTyr-binding forkhead associated (FHA) protein
MALLVRMVDTATGEDRTVSYDATPVRIGRNKANEIVFDKPFVSQWHAQIDHQGNSVFVMDLGSTNGTNLNGNRLQARAPVQLASPSDVIQIGTIRFTLSFGEQVATEQQLSAPVSINERRALTVNINEQQNPEPRSLTFPSSPVRLGRNKLNEIILEQPFVSQWHALVRYQGSEVVVMDLGSTNGTIVNGQRLQSRTPTTLTSMSDVVQIGSITLTFGFSAPVTVEARVPPIEVDAEETALFFDASKWVGTLRGEADPESATVQVGPAMDRVKLLLETFGRSYIELRNGFEQFGKEMGLNVATDSTPLHDAEAAEEVLKYLLEWEAGEIRVDELNRAYTDLALHQVALLNGVMAGVRELLTELSPGGGSWLTRGRGDMEKKRQELLEEDRFSRVVFGKSFARAYFAVTGGKEVGPK